MSYAIDNDDDVLFGTSPSPNNATLTTGDEFVTVFPITPDELKCNQYVLKNKTHLIYGGYEGIPENLMINSLGWLFILCLFTILRKNAWNYGRLALVQKYENRSSLAQGYSRYNVWTHIFYGADKDVSRSAETDSLSSFEFNVHIDKGYFSWLPAIFKIKDEHILAKCGKDAVQYLSFQRHIIIYVMIVCVVCIVIILPINFQGTLEGGEKEFGHTTMSNLDPSSAFMWVHVTLAFLFLPLGIFFMRHFSRSLEIRQLTSSVSRTLMISRVPRRSCHKDTFLKHFMEAYPEVEVQDVQFAYDISRLVQLDKDREVVHSALLYCESYTKELGLRLEMRAYRCGVICSCCDIFGCPKVDAIEYYTQEEQNIMQQVENEKVKALQQPTGIAFVTFEEVAQAMQVKKDHKRRCSCGYTVPGSSVSVDLKPHNWRTVFAPSPDDIYWKHLSVTSKNWYVKAFFINLLLFLFLFFLTTPIVIINSLDLIMLSDKLTRMSSLLSEFLPTLMLWTIAALMPVIVSYSDQFMSHWTRSAQNHSVMRKTFIFLLFMLIILPSLGFTSAKGFVEWFLNQHSQGAYRWECMFLPDNGAFFVNYVITSAFIGTSLELIRFPELFLYIIRLGLARSEAEISSIRKNILYEFQFGVQYAWMLVLFAMTIIYSVSCPLITPFGLVYLIFKHLVDKYNIYFAYGPSRIRKSIHTSAVNFVIVSVVILQMCLLFFSLLRLGLKTPLTIYSITLLCITFLVFLTHIGFNWFKDLSPIEYKTQSDNIDDDIDDSQSEIDGPNDGSSGAEEIKFVPEVLRRDDDFYNVAKRTAGYGTQEDGSSPLCRLNGANTSNAAVSNSNRGSLVGYQNYSPEVITEAEVNNSSPVSEEFHLEGVTFASNEADENTVFSRPFSSKRTSQATEPLNPVSVVTTKNGGIKTVQSDTGSNGFASRNVADV